MPPTDRQNQIKNAHQIDRLCAQLSEHASSVQVVGTVVNPDGSTSRFAHGYGDLHARMRVMDLWLEDAEEVVRGR